jgi:hypothetical protein
MSALRCDGDECWIYSLRLNVALLVVQSERESLFGAFAEFQ